MKVNLLSLEIHLTVKSKITTGAILPDQLKLFRKLHKEFS
ncbi:hypothetical protein MC7420_4710 [Coleofasciculus chthonoplastes PCC 7420]|uniref:Uncharacterized protein n=1 Tax=Coleofasciculus chthonoplastes PCC 7420 TaxID=118168 RepID=B4VNF1_9CYAN|nr:hypothetical protein MC7420_4710 [Coleofasciculus chthonoplastes PCC 7420]